MTVGCVPPVLSPHDLRIERQSSFHCPKRRCSARDDKAVSHVGNPPTNVLTITSILPLMWMVDTRFSRPSPNPSTSDAVAFWRSPHSETSSRLKSGSTHRPEARCPIPQRPRAFSSRLAARPRRSRRMVPAHGPRHSHDEVPRTRGAIGVRIRHAGNERSRARGRVLRRASQRTWRQPTLVHRQAHRMVGGAGQTGRVCAIVNTAPRAHPWIHVRNHGGALLGRRPEAPSACVARNAQGSPASP